MRIGKKFRGLTRTFQGTLFLILLCKVTDVGDFEKHKFSLIIGENLTNLTLQTLFFFATSTKYFHKHIFFGFLLEKKTLGCRVNWQDIFLRISEIYVIFEVTGAGDFA